MKYIQMCESGRCSYMAETNEWSKEVKECPQCGGMSLTIHGSGKNQGDFEEFIYDEFEDD